MKKLLPVLLLLPLVGCVVGDELTGTPGDDDQQPPPTDDQGRITENTTFEGTVDIVRNTTIAPGVTVTVLAGTTINFAPNTRLEVKGALDIQGTSASRVNIQPTAGTYFTGIFVGGEPELTGALTMTYGVARGGKIQTNPGGSVTVTDSKLSDVSGDYFVVTGGTLNVTYSQVGSDVGAPDTTHCNLHFGGNGATISVTKTNIIGTPYGLMLYGGQGVVLTGNNWEKGANGVVDWIDSSPGVIGDFSGGFFAAGLPTPKAGATFTLDNPSDTRLIDAGVRP